MAEQSIVEISITRKPRGRPSTKIARICSQCGAVMMRHPSNYAKGVHGALAGLVFCNRDCQKRMFRGSVRCCWPGCLSERLVEGGNFRKKASKAFFCEAHTSALEAETGSRIVTQKRFDWLADKPIGHRHVTSAFYRWSAFKLGGEKCASCSIDLTLGPMCHIDHVIPVSEGGETRLSNMQPMCINCHKRKSASEQRVVNGRRWRRSGPHTRHMTHVEKDKIIARLRARLMALGAPFD